MSLKSEEEQSDSAMGEDGMSRRESIGKRSWSSSLPRARKGNSRIATVKPVTKCLSSSEEELSKALSSKASPRKDFGSTSPRFARLLGKDVANMEKDAIVAELEKCLNELENDETSYSPLVDEYKRMEEERDELANELENTFEDLEAYMHHVKDVEAEKNSVQQERDELLKEVESLKFCLTSRQQIQEVGLRKEKLNLESQLKKVNEENANMKDQINELLEERQSLINSLLNLHSAEVDDVIQTRSRSCSTVSMESTASSSLLRSECLELKERAKEAEEAEVKITDELIECRNLLKEALEDKARIEDEREQLVEKLRNVELEKDAFLEQTSNLHNQTSNINEIADLKKDNESLRIALNAVNSGDETFRNENKLDRVRRLEEKNATLGKELCLAREECEKLTKKAAENSKKIQDSRAKNRKEKQTLEEKIEQLEREVELGRADKEMLIAAENDARDKEFTLSSLRREKENMEKQMAEIGERLLNERANSKKERIMLEEEVEKVKTVLDAKKIELQRLSNLEASIKEKDAEIIDLRKERNLLQDQIDLRNQEMDKIKTDFASRNRKLEKEIIDLNTQRRLSEETKEKITKLNTEITELKSSKASLVAEKDKMENNFCSLETRLRTEIEKLVLAKEDADEFIHHLETQIEKLKSVQEDLVKTRGEVESLKKLVTVLQEDNKAGEARIEEERSKHLSEKTILEEKLQEKSQQVDDVRNKLNVALAREQKLRETGFKQRKLEQTLSDTLQDKSELEKEKLRLSAQLEDLNYRIDIEGNQRQLMKFESENKNLRSHIQEMEDRNEKLEIENREINLQCKDFEQLVTNLTEEKNALQLEVQDMKSENALLMNDLKENEEKLQFSNEKLSKIVQEKEGMENQIHVLQNGLNNAIEPVQAFTEINIRSSRTDFLKDKDKFKQEKDHIEAIKNLQTEVNRLKSETSALEVDCKNLRDSEIESREMEARLRSTVDRLRHDLSSLDEENVALKKRLENANAEIVELRTMQRSCEGYKVKISTLQESISEEKAALTRQINSLQDKLTKVHQDNKSLLERIRNMEECNATAVRSFKARKNELQMQLANSLHEKEDLEKEVNVLRGQATNEQNLIAKNQDLEKEIEFLREKLENEEVRTSDLKDYIATKDSRIKDLQGQLEEANEQARQAHCTAAEVELQNQECTRKLHESEVLILDLQRAVARANDVAMEKTLECSRNKRLLEKKLEKILKENSYLRNQTFFDGPKMTEREPNSRNRSRSDIILQADGMNGINEHRNAFQQTLGYQSIHDGRSIEDDSVGKYRWKQSMDMIPTSLSEKPKDVTLSRSGSAPLAKRLSTTNSNNQLVKATVTASSVSPPVRYFSDTESLGSKPDSNDDESTQLISSPPKPPPPSYYITKRTSLGGEQDRRSIQPERVHRPIKLKEMPIPNLSPASERRSPRSPVSSGNTKREPGRVRMEHWV